MERKRRQVSQADVRTSDWYQHNVLFQQPVFVVETGEGRNHIFNICSRALSRMCLVGRGERIRAPVCDRVAFGH